MTEFFTNTLLYLNGIFFNNLGLTIIVIGTVSRLAFHPFIVANLKYTKVARDLKPKLDEAKRRHGKDVRRLAQEQARLFKAAGVNPASGALGCLSLIVQLVLFFILFQALLRVINSGINTKFWIWDLAARDTYQIGNFPTPIPGLLVLATAALSLVQSKMMTPEEPADKPTDRNSDPTDMTAFSKPLVLLFPAVVLVSGTQFPSGLVLYWLVVTTLGIIQQYQALGFGGLNPWLKKLNILKS